MRVLLQRVTKAAVTVEGQRLSSIGRGLVLFVAAALGDGSADLEYLAQKTAHLRLFPGDDDRFARSLLEVGGTALVVSQFTLYAQTRKGRRPSFTEAAPPDVAEPLIAAFCERLEALGLRVGKGRFGAYMEVELCNDGPVTVLLDSADRQRSRRGQEPRAKDSG